LASEVLGVSDLVFLRYRDGDIPLTQDSIRKVTQLITDKKPDTVYIPHENDGHRDHRICHTLVTEAIWRAGFNAFQDISGDPWQTATVLTYEVWTPLSAVAVIHDVTGVMDRKLTALRKHASQIRNVAYDEAVSGLNRYRGATTGKGTYCECFGVVRTGSV
jgi:LmbE family N-acetylglucosaminyl deacetylase